MKNKKLKALLAGVTLTAAVAVSSVFGGCFAVKGEDGANGKDLNIYDVYAAAKAETNNPNLTFDEFLKTYFNYTQADIEQATSLQGRINHSLLASVSVASSFPTTTGTVINSGSGVILDVNRDSGDMLVVTNCHVVYKYDVRANNGYCQDISVWLYGGENLYKQTNANNAIKAELISASRKYDLALLKVTGSDLVKNSYAVKAEWANDEECYVGEQVYAIGNASGREMSASVGYISKDKDSVKVNMGPKPIEGQDPDPNYAYDYTVMRISAIINAGNSGGGLFDVNGNLVGLVNARGNDEGSSIGFGYALPASSCRRAVARMLQGYNGTEVHYFERAKGIEVEVTDSYCTGLNEQGFAEIYEAVSIKSLTPSCSAYVSLEAGDVLKHIKITRQVDGTPVVIEDMDINREHNFFDVMLSVNLGDTVEFTVKRRGVEQAPIAVTFQNASGDFEITDKN